MNGYELPHDKILDKPELGKIIHSEIASLVSCHSGGGGAWGAPAAVGSASQPPSVQR
jgi:hypothetical protein